MITTTNTGENNVMTTCTTDLDEYQVADLAAEIQRTLADLEPAVYTLRRQLWDLTKWTANNRPNLPTGVLGGVTDQAFRLIESGYLARGVRDIATTLPDPLG